MRNDKVNHVIGRYGVPEINDSKKSLTDVHTVGQQFGEGSSLFIKRNVHIIHVDQNGWRLCSFQGEWWGV